jgi:release factor glutamine methyltransferase
VLLANVPYVPTGHLPLMPAEARLHEPQLALDGGPDGLEAYRTLIPQAARILSPGAALVVEAGLGQAPQIEALMTAAGLTPQRAPKADLGGVPRAVGGRKMPR